MARIPYIKRKFIERGILRKPSPKRVKIAPPDNYLNILLVSESLPKNVVDSAKSLFPKAEVSVIQHRPVKVDDSASGDYTVHHSDFSLSGKLLNVKLQKLTDRHFDIVINLSQNSSALMWIVSRLKTEIRVGPKLPQHFENDVVVVGNDEPSVFLQNVKRQLELLSNGNK